MSASDLQSARWYKRSDRNRDRPAPLEAASAGLRLTFSHTRSNRPKQLGISMNGLGFTSTSYRSSRYTISIVTLSFQLLTSAMQSVPNKPFENAPRAHILCLTSLRRSGTTRYTTLATADRENACVFLMAPEDSTGFKSFPAARKLANGSAMLLAQSTSSRPLDESTLA